MMDSNKLFLMLRKRREELAIDTLRSALPYEGYLKAVGAFGEIEKLEKDIREHLRNQDDDQ